jgi:hypothetical protein
MLAYALDEYTEVDEHARLAPGRHEDRGKAAVTSPIVRSLDATLEDLRLASR